MSPRVRDQRGASLSVLVLLVVTALLLVAGLVVDGGAQSAAARRAEQAASEAARAAVDAGATARAAGQAASHATMTAAGHEVLDARDVEGTVSLVAGRVRVETRTSTETIFLSLIGINGLRATGEAEAELRAS